MRGGLGIFYNIEHRLFAKNGGVSRLIGRILERLGNTIFCNAISGEADIGENTEFYHHGIGCVIHSKAKIGNNCVIFQNVTLGSKWSNGICEGEAPVIGNNVIIGAGAIILGNITVGDNSIIGANAVVLKDVPENSMALGVPAKIKRREESNGESKSTT